MARNKTRRVVKASLIVVGEGPCDKAFLNHMKGIYDGRDTNQTVKIESADGGSPKDIVKIAVRTQAAYDRRYVLMDSDIPVTLEVEAYAKKHKITLIFSEPVCLEGMLLDVLGQAAPKASSACKSLLHPQLSGPPVSKQSYEILFTKLVLDKTKKAPIVTLRAVLANQEIKT